VKFDQCLHRAIIIILTAHMFMKILFNSTRSNYTLVVQKTCSSTFLGYNYILCLQEVQYIERNLNCLQVILFVLSLNDILFQLVAVLLSGLCLIDLVQGVAGYVSGSVLYLAVVISPLIQFLTFVSDNFTLLQNIGLPSFSLSRI